MKQLFITLALALVTTMSFAQVGIGTKTPKATLDITGVPATTTVVDGIIAPRLTGNELKAKDAIYLAAQTGAQVYVTAAASPTTSKTANVTASGYYYFDGAVWQKVANPVSDKQLGTDNQTLPAATNRTVTLTNRETSKLTIAPAGEEANISTLNVIGGNTNGGITTGITVASNYTDQTNKEGIIKAPQFLNSSPPVQALWMTNNATANLLNIGGIGSGSQASPTRISFRVDSDAVLTNSAGANSIIAMTIVGGNATAALNGNVGIGTENPAEKLHVNGNLRIGSSDSNYISFKGTADDGFSNGDHTYIGERPFDSGSQRSELLLFKGNDESGINGPDRIRLAAGEIRFDTYTSALTITSNFENRATDPAIINRMVIRSTGNVGIGTGNPTEKLHVVGNILANGSITVNQENSMIAADASPNARFGFVKRSGLDPVLAAASTTNIKIGHWSTTSLSGNIGTGNFTEDVTILPNGNVGIGTQTPGSKLAVAGLPVFTGTNGTVSLSAGSFYRDGNGFVKVKF